MEPLLPRERRRSEGPPAPDKERWVTLHIFVRGAGPQWEEKHRLLGWDADRLDVRALLATHKLKALYAFSSSEQRGMQILANPRNGLSLTSYSGKAGSVVRLDADPQATWLERLRPWVGSSLLTLALASALMATRGRSLFIPAGWSPVLAQLNEAPSWPLFALGVLLFLGLFWNRLTGFYR